MNRRQIIASAAGIALSGFAPLSGRAQVVLHWMLSNEELNTKIELPKKNKKRVETNRFSGSLSRYEKLIKTAEAIYGSDIAKDQNGKLIWYYDETNKNPYNITSRAVNYYFDLAINYKDGESGSKYLVEVSDFNYSPDNASEEIQRCPEKPIEDVTVVSLSLEYFYACGNLCGYGFSAKKMVVFNKKEQVTALFMPKFSAYVS